jgi:cytochrome c oxidase subunit II
MNSTKLSLSTVVIIAVAGVVLVAGGFLISSATPLLFPPEASAESTQVDELVRILLIIGGAIFLLVQGMLVYSVFRFRAKPGDAGDGLHTHGNTTLEIVWTVVPAVIVAVLAILSWQVWNQLQTPKENEVSVEVTGRRFNWAFTYNAPITLLPEKVDVNSLPDDIKADLADDNALTLTAPELHTYVGQSVLLNMQSQDVIHALWIPAFRIKQDLIPGRETSIRFTAIEVPGATYPTEYPIRCAELCGANHGLMTSKVIVHQDEASFISDWLVPLMEDKLHPPADPVLAGEKILTSGVYPCPTCHVETNLGWQPASPVAPSLNGVGDRAAGARSTATGLSARDYIYQSVHDPSAYIVPGFQPLMPQLNLPECQALAIVAYLCTQTDSGTPACTVDDYAAKCGSNAPAAEATSEATAEATSGVTSEATSSVTSEATSEATSAPAGEATSEATAEATAGS